MGTMRSTRVARGMVQFAVSREEAKGAKGEPFPTSQPSPLRGTLFRLPQSTIVAPKNPRCLMVAQSFSIHTFTAT